MSAILAEQWIELKPKHTAKWFSRVLGVSVRTGKRYTEHPELFPESRAVDLLVAIEREERRLESRREERRIQREAVRRETRALLGLDDRRADLPMAGGALRLDGGEGGEGLGSVPKAGYQTRAAR